MKYLDGALLADYIKTRQQSSVEDLRINHKITPTLAIIVTIDSPVTELYMRLKQKYADDIGIKVVVHRTNMDNIEDLIKTLNDDSSIHGIIIQLPLVEPLKTEVIVNQIDKNKDVDGLGKNTIFDPATPRAILWLLAGYNIDLTGKNILIIGQGKLVGLPLGEMLKKSDIDFTAIDDRVDDLKSLTLNADIIVTATGQPHLIMPNMLKPKTVIVDAGVASENNRTLGDVDESVFDRDDLTITPKKGGVGPLTICALFDNLINATKLLS